MRGVRGGRTGVAAGDVADLVVLGAGSFYEALALLAVGYTVVW